MLPLFLLALVTGACAQNTIIDVLTTHRETMLLGLLQKAGLTDTLRTGGPFTIFAPTNLAFQRLGSATLSSLGNDTQALADILKYHVVSGSLNIGDLEINEKQLDSLSGEQIRVNYYLYNHHHAVEGARIYRSYNASNGMVYVVDHVLMPPKGNFIDIISTDPDLSTLNAAIGAAGVGSALENGPYTMFAPTNTAFQRLGNDTVQKLLANPTLLAAILEYHVIHGSLYSTGMHRASLSTLEEADRESLYTSFSGLTTSVDGHRIRVKDISATNGVIHKLDSVLIPKSLTAQIKSL